MSVDGPDYREPSKELQERNIEAQLAEVKRSIAKYAALTSPMAAAVLLRAQESEWRALAEWLEGG